MELLKDGRFKDFEAILKKILEHFQDLEYDENVEFMFDKISHFQDIKSEIEDYEKSINSHTRPLRVGFVGGFSTGKSSMINSLLGEEILGVKLEPATSQITELSYGDKFEVLEVTHDEDSYLSYKEISLQEYQKKSTIRVDKGKNLSHYVIKYPSKNLSRFTITDTPGFSSTSKEDDELTKNWINTLDLLIWIFDANKVGDKKEYDKLKELCSNTKVIGVINKIDTKSPGVREKIRNEVLNEEFLDDVYFYSSKKVLSEFTKRNSFNQILKDITNEIKNGIDNTEEFEIKKSGSEITFKTDTITKPFELIPIKKTSYTEYYDTLIDKIDNVRNTEINLILNQTLVKKNNDFRNLLKDELHDYKVVFTSDVTDYKNSIKETNDLIERSNHVYQNLIDDFDTKINACFEVFYTSFFNELGDLLFYKQIDKGLFSDELSIDMINIDDEKGKDIFYEFISDEFKSFLNNSYDIYEKIIDNSIYKEFSNIEEIRNDEYHIINTIVEGLVMCSVDSIVGYHRNFEKYKTESYLQALEFQKQNLDLIIPDELLKSSIRKLLIADLIKASVDHDSSLELQKEAEEVIENKYSEILNKIDNLLLKLN